MSQVGVLLALAALCGVKLPAPDGKSLVPQLRNPREARGQPVYSEFNLQTPRQIHDPERRFQVHVPRE